MNKVLFFSIALIANLLCSSLTAKSQGLDWVVADSSARDTNTYTNTIKGIEFVTDQIGYYTGEVGGKGFIMKTTNGGNTWDENLKDWTTGGYSSITFISADTGFVATYGAIMRTTDEGAEWKVNKATGSSTAVDIQFVNKKTGFAVAGTKLYKTTDAGDSWTTVNIGVIDSEALLVGLCFPSDSIGYAVCAKQGLFAGENAVVKTTNGGESWEKLSYSNSEWCRDVYFVNDSVGFVLEDDLISKTTDGGNTWNSTDFTDLGSGFLMNLNFFDNLNGIAVGDEIYTTTNGGDSWVKNDDLGNSLLYTSEYVSNDLLYTGGSGSFLLRAGDAPTLPAPVAAFKADVTSGEAPLKVTFTDESTNNPTEYSWDFDGDGKEDSKESNPTFTYETKGKYTVSLTVKNAGGSNTKTIEEYINVTEAAPALKASFKTDVVTGDAPLTVNFTDQSTGDITTWKWYIDDETEPFAETKDASYEFALDGTYDIKLVVSDGTNSDDTIMVDLITVNPVVEQIKASFKTDVVSGNAPLTVNFTDQSTGDITTWKWYIDDATEPFAETKDASYEFTTAGTYDIKLVVSDGTNSDDTIMVDLITVNEVSDPLEAAFSADVTTGEAPLVVTFTDESTGSITEWVWEFGDGGTSTDQNPTYTYSTPGTYTVTLTVSDGMAGDNEQKTDYIVVTEAAATCDDPTDFMMSFENESDLANWSLADMNEDGVTWGRFNSAGVNSSQCLGYQTSASSSADDYLISPCFDMEAGKTYKFSFKYATSGSNENIAVYYGRSSEFGLENLLEDFTGINNTDFQTASFTVAISESNSYSFTWYCGSDANSGNFYLDDFAVEEFDGVGIEEQTADLLKVYPNPTTGLINIDMEQSNEPVNINIYNITGKLVMQQQASNLSGTMQLDLSKLNKGLYIVKATVNGSNKVARLTIN